MSNLVRKTVYIEPELFEQAKEALGTSKVSETVNSAMSEVVRQRKLRALADRDFSALTPEVLEKLRAPRFITRDWPVDD